MSKSYIHVQSRCTEMDYVLDVLRTVDIRVLNVPMYTCVG